MERPLFISGDEGLRPTLTAGSTEFIPALEPSELFLSALTH